MNFQFIVQIYVILLTLNLLHCHCYTT